MPGFVLGAGACQRVGITGSGTPSRLTFPCGAKWWQLWKPRFVGFRRQTFLVTAAGNIADLKSDPPV